MIGFHTVTNLSYFSNAQILYVTFVITFISKVFAAAFLTLASRGTTQMCPLMHKHTDSMSTVYDRFTLHMCCLLYLELLL